MPPEEEPKPTPQEIALAEREQRLQAREAELNRRDLTAFLEGQIGEGRILPGQKDEWLNLLMVAPETSIAFGEGEGTAQEALKHLIQHLPKIVEFGDLAPAEETSSAAPSLEEAYKKAGEAYETWRM
jgi:hypothetical protein